MNQEVRDAECCKNCANVETDFHFRDAVLCNKTNTYQQNEQVCNLWKKKKEAKA